MPIGYISPIIYLLSDLSKVKNKIKKSFIKNVIDKQINTETLKKVSKIISFTYLTNVRVKF